MVPSEWPSTWTRSMLQLASTRTQASTKRVDRERALDPVRAARARQVEAHGGEPGQRRHQRRPDVRGAAQPMDAERALAAAGRRLDIHGDAADEVELGHGRLPIRYATDAGMTLRAERTSGCLWKAPSFITARMRSLSCRMRDVGERIAVDQQQVGEIALLHQAELVAAAS